MTPVANMFMGFVPHTSEEPRERLAGYLRAHYQREGFAAKRLANAIRCTPKTAENILDGHWPNSRHMQRIVRHFGRDVLDAMFGPDIDETVSRLKREEAFLEEQLAEKRQARRKAEGFEVGAGESHQTAAPFVERKSFRGDA